MCVVLTVDSLWKFKFKQNITSHREVYSLHMPNQLCAKKKKSKRKKLYFFFVGNASERIHPESIILAPEAAL